jgi:hypothetical protein
MKMITEHIMQNLTPAVGDLIAWRSCKWTVESIIPNGAHLRHIEGLPPETYEAQGPLLLVIDTNGNIDYAPHSEARVLRTNPTYVMERLLHYLDKKGAIDWDQLDADHMQNE